MCDVRITVSIVLLYSIAKVFVCKQWRGFDFDSGWQRSVELPFEAIERGKKFYLPTRRDQFLPILAIDCKGPPGDFKW